MKRFYIVFFAIIILPVIAHAQWEADRKISTNDSAAHLDENMGQCLAVSGDTVHVIFYQNTPTGSALYYKHSYDGGATWSADTRLTQPPLNIDLPSMAVSGKYVHIGFRDNSGSSAVTYYLRSQDAGATWDTKVSMGVWYWWPAMASIGPLVTMALNDRNADGTNTEVYCVRSTDNGTTWETVHQISHALGRSEDPSIVTADGYVHLGWNDNRSGSMQTWYCRSTDNGVTWGAEQQITTGLVSTYCPILNAAGSTLSFACAARATAGASPFEIYFRTSPDDGATWSTTQQLSHTGGLYPVIARDAENIHVMWWNQNAPMAYVHSTDNGTTWDTTDIQLVSATGKPAAAFVVVSGNVVHTIWCDSRSGLQSIYYKRNLTGNAKSSVGVQEIATTPGIFEIESVAPDPFINETFITVQSQAPSIMSMHIIDMLGRTVASPLINETVDGVRSIAWRANDRVSGVYGIRLIANGVVRWRTVMRMK